jgi:hypothetical protein
VSGFPALSRVEWRPSWRILPSRFPPVQLFERVAGAEDLDAVLVLESLTNERLRTGPVVADAEPCASMIAAAFAYRNPDGSRFSDGTFGVFHAASELDTAIAETVHHRERFMRATRQARMEIDMRVYLTDIAADLHDLRSRSAEFADVYHPCDYTAGQRLGRALFAAGAAGIVYDSVRHQGGDCATAFRPEILSNCREERHLCYLWDGERVTTVYEKRALRSLHGEAEGRSDG